MYLWMIGIVVVFAVLGYLNRKSDNILFHIDMVLLTAMLCLRYGQGTDYFGYEVNYSIVPDDINIYYLFHNDVHGEIGYKLLVLICKKFGLSFQVFVGIISLVMMMLAYSGIKKYAEKRTIAVLLLYPTYYLTFFFGVRQGFVLAYTLGAVLPAYIEKRKLKYIALLCLGATIHKSLLILFIPLIFENFVKRFETLTLFMAVLVGAGLGIFLKASAFRSAYYVYYSPSVNAVLLRIILFIAIVRLYRFSEKKDEIDDRIYSFYIIGFCIYIALCPMALISQRVTAYMKISEVILFSRLLGKMSLPVFDGAAFTRLKDHVCMLIICICMVEGIKNMESYVGQGEYYDGIHFYNYPYVTVFNKMDIYRYRENTFYDRFPEVFK